jgi:acetyl-CoA carboxylase carboxyl transferase subunit alpha
MFENAIYSVISPEGCATILWRDPTKTLEAAKAMKLTAKDLLDLKVIDEIIPEPIGGAQRDKDLILRNTRKYIENNLNEFNTMSRNEILSHRKNRFLSIGRSDGFMQQSSDLENLSIRPDLMSVMKTKIIKNKSISIVTIVTLILMISIYFIL